MTHGQGDKKPGHSVAPLNQSTDMGEYFSAEYIANIAGKYQNWSI